MRSRRPSPEHEQAVARRLALLSAELAAVRGTSEPSGEAVQEVEAMPEAGPWPWEAHTRIRGMTDSLDEPSDPARAWGQDADDLQPVPLQLPNPGRHAARRAVLASWLPSGLQGRIGLQPAHLALVATVVAFALGWTTWWVVASEPETSTVPPGETQISAVAGPSHDDTGSSQPLRPAGSEPASASTPSQSGEVVVDVAGRVRRPGLVVLPMGSRVADALKAAGGARRDVDLTSLNLARPLVDGEQLLVGVRTPQWLAAPGQTAPIPQPGSPSPGLVNINTADLASLDTLPGVGPVTAGAIITWRTDNGGFSSVEELLEVNGIGEVTLAELAPLVTV